MLQPPVISLRSSWLRASGVFLGVGLALATAAESSTYFPPRGTWEHRPATELGFDPVRLQAAIDFSVSHENASNKDIAVDLKQTFGAKESEWKLLGPTQPRAALSGIVVRHGYVAATWGDVDRVDMTHSVTKTFLSTVVGLAWQRGMIRRLDEPARNYLPASSDLFASPHNAGITWEHLLRQTSDWSGTLWDMPDWADRPVGATPEAQRNREMHEPGTFYKYNDVRVNLLALVTLHVWKRALPEVLRDEIMQPIGASDRWHWEGYANSWVEIDGRKIQSVSGGGHFGGGMFISGWDMARFGYLFLEHGRWNDRQLVSEKWISLARTPGPANPEYGFANWFLNTHRKPLPSAPANSVVFRGSGENVVYLDWDHDLLVVVRWIDGKALDAFLGQVIGAIRE